MQLAQGYRSCGRATQVGDANRGWFLRELDRNDLRVARLSGLNEEGLSARTHPPQRADTTKTVTMGRNTIPPGIEERLSQTA